MAYGKSMMHPPEGWKHTDGRTFLAWVQTKGMLALVSSEVRATDCHSVSRRFESCTKQGIPPLDWKLQRTRPAARSYPIDRPPMIAGNSAASSAATSKKALKPHGCGIECLHVSSGSRFAAGRAIAGHEDSLAGDPVSAVFL